jgi:DNA-binding transcriptional LysR family regulator
MGISMVPRMVLKTFPDLKLLSVHALPPQFSVAPTVLIRRKGTVSPKVSALVDVLMEQPDVKALTSRRRKKRNGAAAQALVNGGARS